MFRRTSEIWDLFYFTLWQGLEYFCQVGFNLSLSPSVIACCSVSVFVLRFLLRLSEHIRGTGVAPAWPLQHFHHFIALSEDYCNQIKVISSFSRIVYLFNYIGELWI